MRTGCALVIVLLPSTAPLALATGSVVGKTVSAVSISDAPPLGAEPDPNESFQTVREGGPSASIAFVTRRWFLPPSADPAPTAAAVVRLPFRSEDSPGLCTLMNGSLTIRSARE
jgi:hypothetical protein